MTLAENKRIYHDYKVTDHYSAGLELYGHEVKSIKDGGGNLTGSRIIVRGGEAYVIGLKIRAYQPSNLAKTFEQDRTIKLLLTRRQISELYDIEQSKKGFIIPLSLYTSDDAKRGYIKADIGICQKLQKHDKREKLKLRDANLE